MIIVRRTEEAFFFPSGIIRLHGYGQGAEMSRKRFDVSVSAVQSLMGTAGET